MKEKKRLVLVVLGLALISAALTLWSKVEKDQVMYGRDYMMRGVDATLMETESIEPAMGFSAGGLSGLMGKMMDEPAVSVSREMIPPMPYYPGDDALDVDERVYEMYAYYGVVVDDVATYARGIKEYILSIDGRVLSSSINSNQRYKSASLTAKIPVAKFDEANNRVTEGVESVANENVNSQDVTGQHVRLAEDLAKLEEQKAEKELDLLAAPDEYTRQRIQLEIKRLNTQIANLQGTQESAQEQVAYATLSLTAAESPRYFDPRAQLPLWEVLTEAIRSLGGAGYAIGYLAIWVTVYTVIWLPIILFFRFILNKLHK